MPLPPGFQVVQQPQQQASSLPPGFQVVQQAKPYSPTQDMGTMDRLTAGIGQGMTSAVDSIEQLFANNPALLGSAAGAIPPGMGQLTNQRADESARLDQPLMDTTAGKVGSVIGQTVATAPAGVGGKFVQGGGALASMGRAALGGAIAGGAGGLAQPVTNAGETGLGDLVTGNEKTDFNAEKLKQILSGAGIGAAAGGILNRGGALLENLLPSNATANVLNLANRGANKGQLAKEGEALADQTGVMMTPGQISGSKTMNAAENAARQSIFSREIANIGDQKRVQQLADHFERTMDGITKSSASPAVAGAQVQAAVKNTVRGLEDVRRKTAEADFGAVRAMTQGKAAIQPDNTANALKAILEENAQVGTPGADSLAAFASKQLGNVGKEAGQAPAQGNLDKIMTLRSYLSKVAGGQAKISGENQDRRIAAQLLKTIDDDIEANADAIGGDLGGALKKANANYRAVSQQIDSVKASPLGKVLGDDMAGAMESGTFNTIAPEVVMDRMAKLKPTELGVVRGILEKSDPESWAVLKRGLLEDAIEKSKAMPASAGINNAVLRPSQLVKNVGDQKRLEAAFTPAELSEINAGLNVARRLSDSTGYNFSGTAAQGEALNLMNKITAGGIKGAANLAGGALGSRSLARLMTNADGRATLLEMQRLGPKSQRFRELAAKLAAMTSAQEGNSPDQGG